MIKISDAELEVMKIIWNKKSTTSLEIIKELNYKKWSDNTTRTLLNRLVIKKAVGISKKEGKTYIYVPLIKEKEYKAKVTKQFIDKLFNGSFLEFLTFLIKNDSQSYQEIKKHWKN